MDTPLDAYELAKLVQLMRTAQKDYHMTLTSSQRDEMKRLEKEVDIRVADIIDAHEGQGRLL